MILNSRCIVLYKLVTVLGEKVIAMQTECIYKTALESTASQMLYAVGFGFAEPKPDHWHNVGCLAFECNLTKKDSDSMRILWTDSDTEFMAHKFSKLCALKVLNI